VVTRQKQHRKVGELARETGLTVRTLHHYDEIGLLVPSERSNAGHRLYGEEDVRRLYRIVALRQIGLSLEEVAASLEDGRDPRETLQRHLGEIERRIGLHEQLRARVQQILTALDGAEQPTAEQFVEIVEVMTRMEKYYTPEQLADLEKRRNELGDEGMAKGQQDWADLIAEAEVEMNKGTDPGDPAVQELVKRWNALIEAFTGGDPGIRDSLQKMYEAEGPEQASRGAVNQEVMAYMQRAMTAGNS
jgi:DNA-binding transcriptional MerR regulator